MNKIKVGIIGATGMVGQRFITLLENHPYFQIEALYASSRSAGKTYGESVEGRWKMKTPLSAEIAAMPVYDAADIESIAKTVDMVFCAVNMPKEELRIYEESLAKAEIPVFSNNSANRMVADVPMMIPEVNPGHAEVIEQQKKRLGTKRGFIAAKPNCSIQSYVPALEPLRKYGIKAVNVTTFQAISGAGKNFDTWPEMVDNVIPYIGGEEEKSEKEPLKVWGTVENGVIVNATSPVISAQCIRVPASDGHLAAVSVSFENKPSIQQIKADWAAFEGEAQRLSLPHAPEKFLTYFEEDNRPQTRLDRDLYGGMGISIGRLREDTLFDYKFVCLSHNTLRGAAGGAVLGAELLYKQGYLG